MKDNEDKVTVKTFDVPLRRTDEDALLILRAVKYGEISRKYKIQSSFLMGAVIALLISFASMNNLLSNFTVLIASGLMAGVALALAGMADTLTKESHNIFAKFAPKPPKE